MQGAACAVFSIDRRPFVQKVVVGGDNGYVKEWVKDGDSYTRTVVSMPVFGREIPVVLTFSEPVQNPVLTIDGGFGGVPLTPDSSQTTFTGTIRPDFVNIPFMQEGLRRMTITATDMQGNSLLALSPADTSIDIAAQLSPGADGVMQGTPGPDTSSVFLLDNFRPFVQMERIDGGGSKYFKQWTSNGTSLSCPGPAVDKPIGKGDYTIGLRFSEPVVNPRLIIDNYASLALTNDTGDQVNFTASLKLAKGTLIEDGRRTLIIYNALDAAGNSLLMIDPYKNSVNIASELTRNSALGVMAGATADYSANFTVDLTPPGIMLPDQGYIKDIQTKPVLLAAGKQKVKLDDDFYKHFCQDDTGVCNEISGLTGFRVFTSPGGAGFGTPQNYDPPLIKKDEEPVLPAGEYILEAMDAVGNKTSIPVKVADLGLEVSTAGSHIDINRETNSFTGTIHIKARSSAGLKEAKLFDRFLTSVKVEPLFGASQFEGDLVVQGSLDDYYFKTNHFAAGFTDQDGRIVWQPLNLIFSDAKSFANSFGDLHTENYTTPVLDLTQGTPVMMLDGIVSVYAPTKEERTTLPRWQIEGGNGFYSYTTGNPEGWRAASVPVDRTRRENIGRITTVIRTWNNPDRSDMLPPYPVVADRELFLVDKDAYVPQPGEVLTCGNQLGYEPLLDYPEPHRIDAFGNPVGFCYVEHGATNQAISVKRFAETEITVAPAAPTSVLGCHTIEEAPPGEPPSGRCSSIYYFVPAYATAGPAIYGIGVNMETVHTAVGAAIQAGHNVIQELHDGIMANFGANTVFTPGMLHFSYASVENYPGFKNLSGNLAIDLKTEATFDHATLTIPYNAEGLTPSQESEIKIYKITPDGEYIALGTTVDAVNKKVQSPEMDSFGRFMVAAPRYSYPRTVASQANAQDKPQLEFTAEGLSIEQSVFDTDTPEGAALLASIAENGLLVSNVYKLGPEELSLETPGALKMHYDASAAEAAGIRSVALYRANADGTGFYKLSGVIADPVNHEVAAEIWQPAGLYMLIGNTAAAAADRTPPAITVFYGEPKYAQADKLYVSTRTLISITGTDTGTNGGLSSGMGTVYYLVDASPVLENALPYSGPFTLAEGLRTLYYSASDQAGNMAAPSSGLVYVDGTPPSVDLFVGGEKYVGGTTKDIIEGSLITLSPADPEANGVASGLGAVYCLVDVSPEECQAGGAVPAACQNYIYSGPFSLPAGAHTIYYTAIDKVGNTAAGKSAFIKVIPPVTLTSIAVNPSFVFLEIDGALQFTATGKFSDGTSRALTASDGLIWSVEHSTVAAPLQDGLVSGLAYGATRVKVRSGSVDVEAGLFVYNPVPATFMGTGAMNVGRHMHTATLLPDGTVLVAGGIQGGSTYLSSAELYNPRTNIFTQMNSPMMSPRGRGHTATLLPGGKVLITGGINGGTVLTSAELYDPGTGRFIAAASMATARYAHSATLLPDGKVLIAGGSDNNAPVSSVEIYDPGTDKFSPAGAMAAARYMHAAVLLENGKVLVAGGIRGGTPTSSAEVYDPVTKLFAPAIQMKAARAYPKTTLLWNGQVLVTGGYNGTAAVLAAEVYDPGSNSFVTVGSMSVGRVAGHTATLLPNGRVLVAGGDELGGNNAVSKAEIYDPADGKFSTTASMSTGRIYHAAALLLPNGKVLICGGYNGSSSLPTAELYNFGFGVPLTLQSLTISPSSATVEVGGTQQFTATGGFSDGSSRVLTSGLDWSVMPGMVASISPSGLATGLALGKARVTVSSGSVSVEALLQVVPHKPKFISTGSMLAARHIHTATLLPDGTVLIAGGNDSGTILATAELYDPISGAFSATGSMNIGRGRGHTATLLPGGRVLVTGGINNGTTVRTAEIYDPIAKKFEYTGSMAVARYAHSATLLPGGKVLIAGGSDENGPVSSVEIYDPAAKTFSAASPMKAARYMHAAVLLANGKVLVTGGYSGGTPVSGAEEYDPGTGKFIAVGAMKAARAYPKTVLLADGQVLVTGGYNGGAAVLEAELYDPALKSFAFTGSMSVGRLAGHTATLLPDGNVLAAGGDEFGGNNAISSAEVYDHALRTFSVTAPMSLGRIYHAAALLLPNGKVLVCGGFNGSASVSSAELYDSGFRGALSPMLTSLIVEPSTASIVVGGARQFTATGNFSDGSRRVLGAADGLAWSVLHATVAAITADGGLADGGGYGKTSITASSGIFTAEAAISVFYPPGVSNDGLVSLSVPDTGVAITAVSTVTITSTATIFSAMSVAGLKPAMDAFYDFQPSGVQFAAPVKLRFIFDPALVEAAAVAIYYFDGITWSSASIANQATGLLADGKAYVEGYISHTSIYAALYFKDIVAPVTGLAFSAPNFGTKPAYISSSTQLSLAAYDDAVTAGDRLGGLAASYYAVDSDEFTLYSGTFSIAGEGGHVVAYYSVDTAGNRENPRSAAVSADFTPAVSSVSLGGTAGLNGWFVSPVAVTMVSTDSLSGVAGAYYASADEPFVLYRSSFGISGEGSYALRYYAVDNLGNTEAEKTVKFGIDISTPVITFDRTPASNAAGWNNTPVSVVFSGTDTISGISYCTPAATLETEGSSQPVSGYCMDYAGWSSTATLTLNIDKTAPAIMISSPATGNLFVATKDKIGVFFDVADNLDHAPKASALLKQVEDKGSPRGGRPAVIAATYGQSIEPLDIDDGIWRLTVSATDFADNTNTLSGGTFEVVHDVLAPRTTQAIAEGVSLTAGATTYITGDTVLKLSSVDDLVTAEDGIGLGVKKQVIRLKAEGSTVKELVFESPEPKQGAVFASTFTASGWSLADGLYSLAYRAEDMLGNIETEKTFAIGLDNTSPASTAELVGTPGENGWHISSVTIKLAAIDALSGVEGIYYQVESNGQKSELRSYTAPFTISAEGLYKVNFYAKDRLGNTEAEKSIAFKIDHTNPLISAERTPLANTYGWNNTAVTVNYLCTDGLSGVKSCSSDAIIVDEGFAQSASGEAQDNAGNRSSGSVSGVNIDKTAPVSAYRVEGIIYNSVDGKTYLSPESKLSLSAADPVSGGTASGINAVEYHIDSEPFMICTSSLGLSAGIRTVYYRSRDKAGNEESVLSAVFHVDGARPVTSFNISGQPYLVDGTHYINSQSILSFAAADPLTDGLASGVLITKYRLDGGAWQVYAASITIPAEGLHKLDYYSIDNVQNAEALKTLTIIVDNTSPLTSISVGEPKYEVFGLKIITPETHVTLAALDSDAAGSPSGVKSIYYELTDAAGWSSGTLNYTEPFTTGRQGTYIVRYWATDNAGNTGAPMEAKLRVSSLRNDALNAVDGLELAGSADIAGTVRSNTTVSLAGNARILGDVYASTITFSGKAQITGQQHSGSATLIPVPLDLADIVDIASNTNNNSLVPAKYLIGGRLVVPAKDVVTLSTGIYYFNGIELGGGAKVSVNGKIDMLVAGDISINGGASLNAEGSSSRLNIFLSTESALTFTGGGSLAAYVYAPYSQLKLAGNALLGGHYLVKSAIISGAGNIIQAGETLPQAASATGDTGGKKKASALAVGGSYNVLAGPDPAFRLGEVYVFPNPAKNGEAPVFHIETGLADSVSIKIYTVSGRAAHEYTLTGMPVELDDGNGLSYAYEYTWRGHIPSGVYLYYIEAQKAGQTLKKTGKFAVVR